MNLAAYSIEGIWDYASTSMRERVLEYLGFPSIGDAQRRSWKQLSSAEQQAITKLANEMGGKIHNVGLQTPIRPAPEMRIVS